MRNKTKYKKFIVDGQDHQGRWLVRRPDDLMCNGTWDSKESAQIQCDKWNNRKR